MSRTSDLFDVVKYRKQRNSMENKYFTTLEKYTSLLEKDRSILDENIMLKDKLTEANKLIKAYRKQYGRLEIEENAKH